MDERKDKILILVPTNSVKQYCAGKFFKHMNENFKGKHDILVSDDTVDDDSYASQLRGIGYEVIKVTKTVNALKQGQNLDIRQCLANARDALKQEFLARKQYTHAFYLDSDILFPKDGIEVLLNDNKDLVSGVYWTFIARDKNAATYEPVFYKYQDNETRDIGLHNFGATVQPEELWPTRLIDSKDPWITPVAIGTGCFLATRKFMEDKWQWRWNPKTEATEDMWFSIDARVLGYEICVDSRVIARHYPRSWASKIRPGVPQQPKVMTQPPQGVPVLDPKDIKFEEVIRK